MPFFSRYEDNPEEGTKKEAGKEGSSSDGGSEVDIKKSQ